MQGVRLLPTAVATAASAFSAAAALDATSADSSAPLTLALTSRGLYERICVRHRLRELLSLVHQQPNKQLRPLPVQGMRLLPDHHSGRRPAAE